MTAYTHYTNTRGTFDFFAAEGLIIVDRLPDSTGGGWKKALPVVADAEYTVKEQKTQIRASGGAKGLYQFMDNAVRDNFMTAFVDKIIEIVGERGKDACSI